MSDLLAFRAHTSCPKCGHTGLTRAAWTQLKWHKSEAMAFPEYIEFRCTRCQYTWSEHPSDYKEPQNGD